jgi:hypothetical protein
MTRRYRRTRQATKALSWFKREIGEYTEMILNHFDVAKEVTEVVPGKSAVPDVAARLTTPPALPGRVSRLGVSQASAAPVFRPGHSRNSSN